MKDSTSRATTGAWMVVALGFIGPSLADGTPPPAAAFGSTPAFANVALSPDGRTIAMDRYAPGGVNVVFFRPGEAKPVRVIGLGSRISLRGIEWADSDTALVEASETVRIPELSHEAARLQEVWRTLAVDLAGGAPRILLFGDGSHPGVTGAQLLPVNPARKDTVSMMTWNFTAGMYKSSIGTRLGDERRDSGWTVMLFDVDTNSGKARMVAQGTPYTTDWLVDTDGAPLARSDWKADTRDYSVLARQGAGWRTIFHTTDQESLQLAGMSADGKAAIVVGDNGGLHAKAWALPLDGSAPTVAFENADADVTGAVINHETGVVIGYWLAGTDPRLEYVDSTYAALQRALEKAFGNSAVNILDRSADGQRVLAEVESPSRAPVYYLVDRTTHRADIVGETYPGLADATLGEVQSISYKARDGAAIPAILTLPPGKGDKNLPLVVLVHGGPEWHDSGGFDWWAQFLATRGYAVLQPQFRGSTGYGNAHRLAGYRQWGGLMQDDVTDGVRYLESTGVADPKRVCIMGGSYGGYAALAGAAFTPDLYACAVSVNGVSDLPQMIGDLQARAGDDADAVAYWKDHIGSPQDPRVAQVSPARSAGTIRAPILLMHGSEDTVVPAKQSKTMAAALDAARKTYEYVPLPGEDHWLSSGTTRTEVLKQIEAFLAKYLGP